MNAEELSEANAAALKLKHFFREVCNWRRERPGADLVSLLLQAEEGADHLHEDEIIANIILLFVAGHETTANMLGNTLALLFHFPEQLASLRAQPELIPKVVEESLRFDTSVQFAFRTALEPVRMGDAAIEAGDSLYVALGAANHDPEVFVQPECFLIDRPDETAKTLAFGGGGHYCLGARLARIELETALEVLFRRLPAVTIDNPDQLKWKSAFTVRGLESLPARW
ncbi:MAG: cytochrome P450 [Methylococcaceae bacterium]|nr:cytochrome P450 [Methylococcaceae bacterium]